MISAAYLSVGQECLICVYVQTDLLLCLDLEVSSLENEVFLVQSTVPCGEAEELVAVGD